jgi:hypothetical protein
MLRIDSTSLIGIPETSSVGQSEIDCATPYSHNPWSDDRSPADWMLQIECTPGHFFVFQGHGAGRPDLTDVDQGSAFLRLVCHALVEKLDENGLKEACESLAEFVQYYLPKERSLTHQSPSTTQNRPPDSQVGTLRRILPSVEARPFHISEG